MGPKTSELLNVLSRLETLLSEADEHHWKDWIIESKRRLLASDASGITKLLAAYGGMGSFNDLIIHQNDTVAQQDLIALRSQAWKLADEIKREVNL